MNGSVVRYYNIHHVDDRLKEVKERSPQKIKHQTRFIPLSLPTLDISPRTIVQYDNYDPESKYLSKDQVNELLFYAGTTNLRDYALLRLLWVTGMRVSEALKIRPDDISYGGWGFRYITIINLKHKGAQRVVYFDELTERVIKQYISLYKKKGGVKNKWIKKNKR